MAHALKPDFDFRRNGRVHLNRRWRQFSRLLAAEVCGISGSNAGYTMFRGSVKCTGYPLHSLVSPSLPLPYLTVCHHISSGVYKSPCRQFNRDCQDFASALEKRRQSRGDELPLNLNTVRVVSSLCKEIILQPNLSSGYTRR